MRATLKSSWGETKGDKDGQIDGREGRTEGFEVEEQMEKVCVGSERVQHCLVLHTKEEKIN